MVICIKLSEFDINMPEMELLLGFLALVRVWLIANDGEISSREEMVFLFSSPDSNFSQNNVFHDHRAT